MGSLQYKKLFSYGIMFMLLSALITGGAVRTWSFAPVLMIEAFLICLLGWKANNSPRYPYIPTAIDKPLAIFSAIAFVSFIFSVYKYPGIYTLLSLLGYAGIYYIIIYEYDHVMEKRLILCAVSAGAALSIYGFLQYFGNLPHQWWDVPSFLSATFVNHNHFSGYLELVIPAAIGLMLSDEAHARHLSSKYGTKRPRVLLMKEPGLFLYRLWLIMALIIMVAAIVLAQSRGAWVSMTVSYCVMVLILARKNSSDKKAVLVIILLVIAAAVLVIFGQQVIAERIGTPAECMNNDLSLSTRLLIWQGSLDMIRHAPLVGMGPGTFAYAFSRFRPFGLMVRANFAHNDYLELAAGFGIPALIAALWMLWCILKRGLRIESSPLIIGLGAGVLSLAIHGLVDFNFHIPSNMLLFSIWCGCIMRRSSMSKGEES